MPRAVSVASAGSTKATLPDTTSGNAQALVTTKSLPRAHVSAAENPKPSTSDGTTTAFTAETYSRNSAYFTPGIQVTWDETPKESSLVRTKSDLPFSSHDTMSTAWKSGTDSNTLGMASITYSSPLETPGRPK